MFYAVNKLQGAVADPKRPFAAVVGGSKVSSKIGVIDSMLNKVHTHTRILEEIYKLRNANAAHEASRSRAVGIVSSLFIFVLDSMPNKVRTFKACRWDVFVFVRDFLFLFGIDSMPKQDVHTPSLLTEDTRELRTVLYLQRAKFILRVTSALEFA